MSPNCVIQDDEVLNIGIWFVADGSMILQVLSSGGGAMLVMIWYTTGVAGLCVGGWMPHRTWGKATMLQTGGETGET
jgi:hypothetical protein